MQARNLPALLAPPPALHSCGSPATNIIGTTARAPRHVLLLQLLMPQLQHVQGLRRLALRSHNGSDVQAAALALAAPASVGLGGPRIHVQRLLGLHGQHGDIMHALAIVHGMAD